MKSLSLLFFIIIIFLSFNSFSQNGLVRGHVLNAANNEAIAFVKISILDQQKGAISLEDGSYEIRGIAPGIYSFKASCPGFKDQIINEILVTNARSIELDFNLDFIVKDQKEVVINGNRFLRNVESPVSLKTLNSTEIERLPGANRDVSRVIAALPGVASRATFRNDIIIRGGSPGENKFYLDGIEVPNINHFATQGSSGGPV